MKSTWKVLSLVLFFALIVSGCGQKAKNNSVTLDPDTKVTLKITYFNEQSFYQTYGNVFQTMFPNVEFEIVQTGGIYL